MCSGGSSHGEVGSWRRWKRCQSKRNSDGFSNPYLDAWLSELLTSYSCCDDTTISWPRPVAWQRDAATRDAIRSNGSVTIGQPPHRTSQPATQTAVSDQQGKHTVVKALYSSLTGYGLCILQFGKDVSKIKQREQALGMRLPDRLGTATAQFLHHQTLGVKESCSQRP